jgi:hypothetical protein
MKNTTNLLNYNAKPYLQTYRKIREKLYGVHLYWEIFKQLYAGNRTRFAIINEAALEYFYYSQDVYLAYVESGLMRLADPSETCGKRNMSIQRLVEEVENFEQCPAISLELRKMLRKFEEQIIELKDRRNKTRAHNDYEVALGKVRVSSISRKHVNDALRVLKKLMSEIESHIGQKGLVNVHLSKRGILLIDYFNVWKMVLNIENCLKRVIPGVLRKLVAE